MGPLLYIILFLANPLNCLIAEFVQTFDLYHLEQVTYDAATIPILNENDEDIETAKEVARNSQIYYTKSITNNTTKTLVLLEHSQLESQNHNHNK